MSPTEATVDLSSPGSRLDADHPENGVLIPCLFTVTPHAAWLTPESEADTRRKSAETMRAALLTNRPQNVTRNYRRGPFSSSPWR